MRRGFHCMCVPGRPDAVSPTGASCSRPTRTVTARADGYAVVLSAIIRPASCDRTTSQTDPLCEPPAPQRARPPDFQLARPRGMGMLLVDYRISSNRPARPLPSCRWARRDRRGWLCPWTASGLARRPGTPSGGATAATYSSFKLTARSFIRSHASSKLLYTGQIKTLKICGTRLPARARAAATGGPPSTRVTSTAFQAAPDLRSAHASNSFRRTRKRPRERTQVAGLFE